MKQFARRELLRGLAASSALAALGSLAHAAPAFAGQIAASPFQRVNILFHGAFVIEFTSDEVHVYLPSAPSGYAYLAGSWMQEVPLAHGGEYRLSGVMTGPRPELRTIDPDQNVVFHDRAIVPGLAFCRLALPFPDYFAGLRLLRMEHRKPFFIGSSRPILEPSAVPQVVALGYVHPDVTSRLELRPLVWTPVIEENIVNLHVWDAPAKTPTPEEAADLLTDMAKMIGLPSLGLNPVYAEVEPPPPDARPAVPGLDCDEEWTLIERLSRPDGCGIGKKHDSDKMPFGNLSLVLY